MNQESEVHGLLLTIVVCNLHDGLNMIHHVFHAQHADDKLTSMPLPAFNNFTFMVCMQHEMTEYDSSLNQNINVELLLK